MAETPERRRAVTLWRVFPWDESAEPGVPFSAASVAPREQQGAGRFDIPEISSVLYLAETPEHAYAEVLRRFAAETLTAAHLKGAGLPLAHCPVEVPLPIYRRLSDLADPAVLLRYGVRADLLALPRQNRKETQNVARMLFNRKQAGLRWWSAIHGGWHSTVLFVERAPIARLGFGEPTRASLDDPAVLSGARAASMRLP